MTKLTRTFVIVAVGAAILAAGSVAAVKASVSFVQGFGTTTTEAGCTTSGPAPRMLLAPEGRWNGQWQPATSDVSSFAWAGCSNGWAHGYVNGARPESLDLSTLPMMR